MTPKQMQAKALKAASAKNSAFLAKIEKDDDWWGAYQELGEIIKAGTVWEPAFWIQFFCDLRIDGETPQMALALTKKEFKVNGKY